VKRLSADNAALYDWRSTWGRVQAEGGRDESLGRFPFGRVSGPQQEQIHPRLAWLPWPTSDETYGLRGVAGHSSLALETAPEITKGTG
jgi:hypothetical protein